MSSKPRAKGINADALAVSTELPLDEPRVPAEKWHPSTKAERQEFFLPVSGFVWFYPEEVEIIDHPAFQRLARINQLGQAHIVFRGGTHKRLEHVLGVVHVINKMISATRINSAKNSLRSGPPSAPALSDDEERFLRLGALLHDIGHVAAGHTLEDELGLLGKHDADDRLTLVFSKNDWDTPDDVERVTLGDLIDRLYLNYVPKTLTDKGLSPTDIVRLLVRKQPRDGKPDPYSEKKKILMESEDIRFSVCSNMIGNTICADLLDYIYRDWYHLGKTRSIDDRIFQYMEIRRSKPFTTYDGSQGGSSDALQPSPSPDDRFVIALGRETKIRTDGVSAILSLLEWRYELAEAVLFHRTKVASGAMLDRALFELWETVDEANLLRRILETSDEELIDVALKEALQSSETGSMNESLRVAANLLRGVKHRRIFTTLATFDHSNLTVTRIDKAKIYFGGDHDTEKVAAANRTNTARNLERDFEIPAGSIAIYCSTIKPKIAEVSIAVDGYISPFAAFEEAHDSILSGGHLKAQINRFEKMWRIQFFISDSALATLNERGKAQSLRRAIADIVLSDEPKNALEDRVQEFAKAYVHDLALARSNSVRYQAADAAWRDPSVASMSRYPNGAPCVRNYIKRED